MMISSVLQGLVVWACLSPVNVASAEPMPSLTTDEPALLDQFASLGRESRLRKLHLVRPDLIPYPIAHEVYC